MTGRLHEKMCLACSRTRRSRALFAPALILLLGIVPGTVLRGAYLEVGPGSESGPAPPRIVPRPPPFPPVERDEVDVLLERVRVARGFRVGGLDVFPVVARGYAPPPSCVSLNEALDAGWVRVRDSDRIDRVFVENRGRRYVFILAGQTIRGGRQNRMVRWDVILRPHSGVVEVPVYCVEKGRWRGRLEFESAPGIAPASLRSVSRAGGSQEVVWEEARRVLDIWEVSPPTGDLDQLFRDTRVQARLERVLRGRRYHWPRGSIGMVVLAGDGRVLGCDLFGDPSLFAALREEILVSYFLGGGTDDVPRAERRWPGETAERFLDRVRRARPRIRRGGIDAGEILEFVAGGIAGHAAVLRGAVVHLDALPRRPRPLPPVPPRPLQEFRGGR